MTKSKIQPENVATAPDNNPIKRKPLTHSPAMRAVAERAAEDQPHIIPIASNNIEWREVFPR